ncbi:hypothetical protein Tco_0201373 [Tanacetum coccineum]
MKAEALKKQTTASRPIKALTVYRPNTPETLVPRVLLTKSQVKINIFTLIQLFSKFEKTCKRRITPTGLTEGERGFEQTKECYLKEVIPLFKTLKEHFEGIQKALIKEIKEMEDVFKELEAEVDQNAVDRKHDEIERKNLLIAHDNLIADCLSKEVFYVVTNSELSVSRFTKMHDAHTIVEARCLELEAELSNLREKIQNDNHNELVKRFSKLEITRAKHLEQSIALTSKNENLKAQMETKMKSVTKDHVKPTVLAPGKYAIDVEPIPPRNRNNREVHLDYLKHLKESVETLRQIMEEVKVERPLDRSIVFACRYTKHSQELLEYAIGTCPKDFNKQDKKYAPTHLISKKQVTFEEQCHMSNRVNCCTNASRSHPRSNTKKNKISPAKGVCENSYFLKVIMLNFEGWKLDGYQVDGRLCVVLKMVLVGQMDSPPQSPNHVFNFPENEEEFEEDPEEEVEEWDDMDIIEEEEEDPEEDPEEWDDVDAAEQVDEIPHPVTPPRNPTAVPHSSLC